jgi:hypothetical protein
MPYEGRDQQARRDWLTLPDTVAHVRKADGCGELEAQRQITLALADRALGPIRWDDERETPAIAGPVGPPPDTPPIGKWWREAPIDWVTGHVTDSDGLTDEGRKAGPAQQRILLIHRHSVAAIWSRDQAARAPSAGENGRLPTPTQRHRAATSSDELEFQAWVADVVNRDGAPPARADAEQWAKARGTSVAWARRLYSKLPLELKLSRGQTRNRRRANRQ